MGSIWVSGGKQLNGETTIQGAKNAALPLMAAAVLHKGNTVLHNCPRIQDVEDMRMLLEDLGCRTMWEGHTLYVDASQLRKTELDPELTVKIRGSVLLMGSLLGRCKEVILPFPGGCVIGKRPINYHLDLMQKMGAEIICREDRMILRAGHLTGRQMQLPFPSVGATENGILAGVLAEGENTLICCAEEPEIQELCLFLKEKGAHIVQKGRQITISGVKKLKDSEYTLMPDRIVAGTYLFAALACQSRVTLHQVPLDTMASVRKVIGAYGGKLTAYADRKQAETGRKTVEADCRCLRSCQLDTETAPYPGFPTDLQSQLMAVAASRKDGSCRICETMFEDRFLIAKELRKMGADIRIDGKDAVIYGVGTLHPARLTARELRGGAALILAALTADGVSQITPDVYIKRGYENISKDLEELGADICEITADMGSRIKQVGNRS